MRATRQLIAVIMTLGIAMTPLAACSSSASNSGPLGDSSSGDWSTYTDVDGDSGVVAYQAGPDHIWVRFESGTEYQYTEATAGPYVIDEMKRLAAAGDGLNSFISRDGVKYAQKRQPQSSGIPATMDQLSSQWLQQWNAASETDRAAVCRDYRLAPTMVVNQQANSVWDFVLSNYPADTRTEISLTSIQGMYQEALSSHC